MLVTLLLLLISATNFFPHLYDADFFCINFALLRKISVKGRVFMKKAVPDKEYNEKVKKLTPPSPLIKDCLLAFLFGGIMCVTGELLFMLYDGFFADEKVSRTAVSISVIVFTAILTGIGVYDKLAKVAGAGLAVPISGFANSVCSPAIEYSTEGHILGTSEKMFSLAGAVIVYGCSLASLYGMIYYFFLGGKV